MNTTKLLFVLIFCTFFSINLVLAQKQTSSLAELNKAFVCRSHNPKLGYLKGLSKEELKINGFFDFQITLIANDTIIIDDINFYDSPFIKPYCGDSINSSFNLAQVFDSLYLMPGHSGNAIIQATYNPDSLPYYPTNIGIKIKVHKYNDSLHYDYISSSVKVYFTPYNSIEIWDLHDYFKLPRVWAVPLNNQNQPTRIFIPRDSIPASTRPNLNEITEAWQKQFQLARVPGLPYLIQMAAVHPDTIKYYKTKDSIEVRQGKHDGQLHKKSILGNTFNGIIQGNLVATYVNDLGDAVVLGLEGVKIAV